MKGKLIIATLMVRAGLCRGSERTEKQSCAPRLEISPQRQLADRSDFERAAARKLNTEIK